MRKREKSGDEGNHHEKLKLMRILGASKFTNPNTTGTTSNPEVRVQKHGLLHQIKQVIPLISHLP
jgi:hypothetical protein